MTQQEDIAALTAAAQLAKANAETDATAAQTAKNNAVAWANDIQTTKDDIQGIAGLTRAAKTRSETAATNAETAQHQAEQHAKAALTSKNNAETWTSSISSFKEKVETTSAAVEQAKEASQSASEEANEAKELAEKHADSADSFKDTAETAASASITAQEKAENSAKKANEELSKAQEARILAEKESKNAAIAHNLSTTVGIAGAFNDKAGKASASRARWSVSLFLTLMLAAAIGWWRFNVMTTVIYQLLEKNAPMTFLYVEVLLSVLSIAPFIWFSWLSTKMISKYFHLSEDYAYKAALAKAYLGFKEQAAGLDDIFEERLFAAAVTQLDANPLRFFESSSHPGSPIQDLLQQPFMQSVLEQGTVKDEFVAWMNRFFKTSFYVPKIEFRSPVTIAKPEGE